MAFSSPAKGFDRKGGGPRRLCRLVMRVVAVVTALMAVGCTAWMLYQLRRWKTEHPEGDYQADEFILAWLILTLALSALASTTAILITTTSTLPHPPKPPIVPPTATLATDILLALSLLASGIWLTLAATTAIIDGNTALNVNFHTPSSRRTTVKSAIEVVGISLTFVTAILHILPSLHFLFLLLLPSYLNTHNHNHNHNHNHHRKKNKNKTISPPLLSTKTAMANYNPNDEYYHYHNHNHIFTSASAASAASAASTSPLPLPLHPAYRPPLPYPDPHHPTCAYPNWPPAPAPAQRYQWHGGSRSGGVHACERSSSLSMQCIGEAAISTEVWDGKVRVR